MHLAEFPAAADLERMRDAALERRWEVLLDARSAVNAKLEVLREQKVIGSSLQAKVVIDVDDVAAASLLKRYAASLPMLFIVSEVTLGPKAAASAALAKDASLSAASESSARAWTIDAAPASGEKCPRCWRVVPNVSAAGESLGLCDRCVDAMGSVTAGGLAG